MKRSPKTHLLHRSLEKCQRETRQRALTAKMMPTKAAINTSLLHFLVSENREMGFPNIYRPYRVLQRLKISPMKKEKVTSKGDDWPPSPGRLWCSWSRTPAVFEEPKRSIPSSGLFLYQATPLHSVCFWAPANRETELPGREEACLGEMLLAIVTRAGQTWQGRRRLAKDCWEEQAAEMLEMLIFQQPRKLQPVDWKKPTCKTLGVQWSLIYSPIWFWVHLVCLYR